MTKCTATLIGLLLVVSTGLASDPMASRPVRKFPPAPPTATNPYLKAAADLDARDRIISKCIGQLTLPQPRIAEAIKIQTSWRYDTDANFRMVQLLNKSEDLRQARELMHRFWMNNQPAVLTYDRLKGAIGP
jgi:hypothetical protein